MQNHCDKCSYETNVNRKGLPVNCNDCEITEEDRKKGIDIKDLLK